MPCVPCVPGFWLREDGMDGNRSQTQPQAETETALSHPRRQKHQPTGERDSHDLYPIQSPARTLTLAPAHTPTLVRTHGQLHGAKSRVQVAAAATMESGWTDGEGYRRSGASGGSTEIGAPTYLSVASGMIVEVGESLSAFRGQCVGGCMVAHQASTSPKTLTLRAKRVEAAGHTAPSNDMQIWP